MKRFQIWFLLIIGIISTEGYASISIGDFEYTVLSESRREIRINGPRKGTELKGDIVIPATVIRPSDGLKYTVVEIGLASGNIRDEYTWTPAFCNQPDITSVTIPATVTSIWSDTFSGCSSIKSFKVADGNPAFASVDGVLYSKYNGELCELLRFPAASALKTFSVPADITVEYGAFRDNKTLTTLKLNAGARLSQGSMVGNLGIKSITQTTPGYYNIKNGMILSDDGTVLFCVPPALTTGKFTVPATVTTLGRYACASIRASSVDFANVTIIRDQAFLTAGIKELSIPATVTEIGYAAFEECKQLETAVINSKIKILPVAMFRNCENLTSVKLPTSCVGIGGKALFGCKSLETFSLANFTTLEQANTISDYHFAFSGITKINWPSKVKAIPEKCFFNCKDMKELRINDQTEIIKEYAFYNTNIETFNSSNLKEIHQYAFEGNNSLRKIVLAETDHTLRLGNNCFLVNPGAEIFINHSDLQASEGAHGTVLADAFYGYVADATVYTQLLNQSSFFENWDMLYVPAGATGQYERYTTEKGKIHEMFSVKVDGASAEVKPNYDWVKITGVNREGSGLEVSYTARGVKMHTVYPPDFIFDNVSSVTMPADENPDMRVSGRVIKIRGCNVTFFITDSAGVRIASGNCENESQIALERPGVYIVRVNSCSKSLTRKIFVK